MTRIILSSALLLPLLLGNSYGQGTDYEALLRRLEAQEQQIQQQNRRLERMEAIISAQQTRSYQEPNSNPGIGSAQPSPRSGTLAPESSEETLVPELDPVLRKPFQQPGAWFANVEAVFLKPSFGESNNAFTIDTGPPAFFEARGVPFEWERSGSPRVEIGFLPEANGLGWRARWWSYDHATDPQTSGPGVDAEVNWSDEPDVELVPPGGFLPITSTQTLDLEVWDFEVIIPQEFWSSSVYTSTGFRVASLENDSVFRDSQNVGRLIANNDFQGAGPTAAVELHRPLFTTPWGDSVNLIAGTRGSLLFGDHRISGDSTAAFENVAISDVDDAIPVVEFQLGGEISRPVGKGTIFFEVMWESQFWMGAGTSGARTTFDGVSGSVDDLYANDIGLHGITVGGGVTY